MQVLLLAVLIALGGFSMGCGPEEDIGVIGGADGPTTIYIAGSGDETDAGADAPEDVWPTAEQLQAAHAAALKQAGQAAAPAMTKAEADAQGLLLLINRQHPVDSEYKADDLASIKYFAADRSESGRYMRAEAADAFHLLVETAQAEQGYTIVVTTAYRSYSFQKTLWDNYVAKDGEAAASTYSARPGTSEHQSGLAADVSSPSVNYQLTREYGQAAEGIWLAENAHRFGFIIRFPDGKEDITGYNYEPWHLRYVGTEAAAVIYENDITLEEYLLL